MLHDAIPTVHGVIPAVHAAIPAVRDGVPLVHEAFRRRHLPFRRCTTPFLLCEPPAYRVAMLTDSIRLAVAAATVSRAPSSRNSSPSAGTWPACASRHPATVS